MITSREIANLANEWRLAHHVVDKDYVLGRLLAAISEHPQTRSWAFKGGTCLRKCFFETTGSPRTPNSSHGVPPTPLPTFRRRLAKSAPSSRPAGSPASHLLIIP